MPDLTLTNETGQTLKGTDGSASVTIAPGGEYTFKDFCQGIHFVNSNGKAIIDSTGGEFVDKVNEMAGKLGCAERVTPVAVAPTEGPGTGSVAQGGDTAPQQGAPKVQDQVSVKPQPTPAGSATDGRQPTEALHDQHDPRPEGEIHDDLVSKGATQQEADVELERARKGKPPIGEKDSSHSGDQSTQRSKGGEPVDLFSGRFVIDEVDLEVPSPFQPITLARRYVSGRPYFGPWGFNWDHNWNVFIRELTNGDVVRWNGALHEDLFVLSGAGFDPPRGVFEVLERLPGPGTAYRVSGQGGITRDFSIPPLWSDAERIPLIRVSDRAGNALNLSYDNSNRLLSVIDRDGRGLFFEYGECGFLERVRDHANRALEYLHDDDREHLIAVRTPATPDYPKGILTRYDYASPTVHPAQRHNVIRIIDNDNNTVTQNAYGEDPAELSFNRVVRQLQGGFFYEFSYEMLQWLPNDPLFVDDASTQTTLRSPDRSLWTYTFNSTGDLLDERVRLNHDGSFRVVIRKLRYDPQGNLKEETFPDGSRRLWTYDFANADPRNRGNLLRAEMAASPIIPAPSRIVFRAQYDPKYQLLRLVTHENGAQTKYLYDFDLTPAPQNIGALWRIEWPDCTLPDGTIQKSATNLEFNSNGQLTAIVSPEGHRDEIRYEPLGSTKSGFRREYRADVGGSNEITTYDYDAFGYPSEIVEPGPSKTSFVHNALGQRTLQILPYVGGAQDTIEWRYGLEGKPSVIRTPRGQYSDGVITDTHLEEQIEVNPIGHAVKRTIGANTAVPRIWRMEPDFRGRPIFTVDPTNITTRTCFDERGLLLFETLAYRTSAEQTTRFTYDISGRLIRIEEPATRITTLEYDPWGRVSKRHLPNGSTVSITYNEFDFPLLQEVTGSPGDGTPDRVLRRIRYSYDERGRLTKTSLERFEANPAATVSLTEIKWYDRDGHCIRRVTPRGDIWLTAYDGRGRQTQTTDPLGNLQVTTYGPDGLPARISNTEVGPTGASTRFVDHQHDARRRLLKTTTSSGQQVETIYDARNLPVERKSELGILAKQVFGLLGESISATYDPTGLNLVSSTSNDLLGRPIAYTDPTGETSTVQRDELGRVIALQLADGSTYGRTYGPAGELSQVTTPDGSSVTFGHDVALRTTSITAIPGAGRLAVPQHSFFYDGLDRIVGADDGTLITRSYDSLDRLIAETTAGVTFRRQYDDLAGFYDLRFPTGRRERHELDEIGRVRRIVLADPGTSPLAGASGVAGSVLLNLRFRGPARIAEIDHANGIVTRCTHDIEGRLVRIDQANGGGIIDGTRYRLDLGNRRRLVQITGPLAGNRFLDFDNRSRLVRSRSLFVLPAQPDPADQLAQNAQITAGGAAAGAAGNEKRYTLNGADCRTTVTSISGAHHRQRHTPTPLGIS